MSMSLDGYVADENDGVDEVFDWYFSGDVEVPTASGASGMTFRVSAPSAVIGTVFTPFVSRTMLVLPALASTFWKDIVTLAQPLCASQRNFLWRK